MEITPSIGPEDIDPRKVQRLLYVALGCVVLAGVMAWLSARASAAASASAEYAGIEAKDAAVALADARQCAEAALYHANDAQRLVASRVPTTTTEAPNAEAQPGSHDAAPQDHAGGAGAAGAA